MVSISIFDRKEHVVVIWEQCDARGAMFDVECRSHRLPSKPAFVSVLINRTDKTGLQYHSRN